MQTIWRYSQRALENGWLPDGVIRWGIRRLLRDKLKAEERLFSQKGHSCIEDFVNVLKASPIAVNTREANTQHYELPTEFFQMVMGEHMKYSCGFWKDGVEDLTTSERDMLELTCERASLSNGQEILELGCGWGSLTMFMARKYPQSRITAVSNSRTQKMFIDEECRKRGLSNVGVITADMNDFWIDRTFDRVVSVEMFEHMRNYQKLLEKVSCFLKDDGRLFIHIFTHKRFAYLYQETEETDWIAKYFFTGGIMPSDDLLSHFDDHFDIEHQWQVSGDHYRRTSEAWLANMDRHREEIVPIFKTVYGQEYRKWWVYWRVFFMSCAELWGYRGGTEWIVSHYLLRKAFVPSEPSGQSHIQVEARHLER